MELQFTDLKQKDVINITDGKNLGKVCDLTFLFPANNVLGITVTGGRGFKFTKKEQFIPVCDIERIGEDAVLVKIKDGGHKEKPPECPPPKPRRDCPPPNPPPGFCDRRSFDEYE